VTEDFLNLTEVFLTLIEVFLCLFLSCEANARVKFAKTGPLAMGLTVRGSNPGGSEIFRTCPHRPWVPTNLLYNGYRVFTGCKERPGRDADPSFPSSAVVMKE
jgi:hypothetical protein